MSNIIITQRLEIKPYSQEDQAAMIELLTNEEIKKNYMIPDFPSKEEVIVMFQKLKDCSLSNEHYERGIFRKNQLIGFVNDVEIDNGTIELGYVIHPNHQKLGYATEMLHAVIKDLFELGYHTVITGAFEENEASIRVMKKCGMTKMEKEDEISYHQVMHHCVYYRKQNDC